MRFKRVIGFNYSGKYNQLDKCIEKQLYTYSFCLVRLKTH